MTLLLHIRSFGLDSSKRPRHIDFCRSSRRRMFNSFTMGLWIFLSRLGLTSLFAPKRTLFQMTGCPSFSASRVWWVFLRRLAGQFILSGSTAVRPGRGILQKDYNATIVCPPLPAPIGCIFTFATVLLALELCAPEGFVLILYPAEEVKDGTTSTLFPCVPIWWLKALFFPWNTSVALAQVLFPPLSRDGASAGCPWPWLRGTLGADSPSPSQCSGFPGWDADLLTDLAVSHHSRSSWEEAQACVCGPASSSLGCGAHPLHLHLALPRSHGLGSSQSQPSSSSRDCGAVGSYLLEDSFAYGWPIFCAACDSALFLRPPPKRWLSAGHRGLEQRISFELLAAYHPQRWYSA